MIYNFVLGDSDKYGKREGPFGKLLMPGDSFLKYISALEKTFMENIESAATQKLEQRLYNELTKIQFCHPCPNFPQEYLLKLYIRMRIFYVVKYANRSFQNQQLMMRRENKCRKLQILNHK